MIINSIDCILLTAPYAGIPGSGRSYSIIRLVTDTGLIGYGEPYAGVNMPLVVRQIVETLSPHLIGMELKPETNTLNHFRNTCEYFDHRGLVDCVWGAIDWAIHDLLAQADGQPLCRYLSEDSADSVSMYASCGPVSTPVEQVIDHLHEQHAHGFRHAKIRAGCGQQTATDAAERSVAILKRLQGKMKIGVDAGQQIFWPADKRWSLDAATYLNQQLANYEPLFLEDPICIHDLQAYRSLTAQQATPIAGGEMFSQTDQFAHYLAQDAWHIAQPDAAVLVGPHACIDVDRLAMHHKVKTVMHGWAGPVAQMQNIHAALAMQSCDLVEFCTLEHPFLRDAMQPIWQFSDGRFHAPTQPGLGITIDVDLQNAYPFTDTSTLIA